MQEGYCLDDVVEDILHDCGGEFRGDFLAQKSKSTDSECFDFEQTEGAEVSNRVDVDFDFGSLNCDDDAGEY